MTMYWVLGLTPCARFFMSSRRTRIKGTNGCLQFLALLKTCLTCCYQRLHTSPDANASCAVKLLGSGSVQARRTREDV
jgi:hypothetical protein